MIDSEYNAALELELFCEQKIQEGFESVESFSLNDKLMYYSRVIYHEMYALSSLCESERLSIKRERLMELINLGTQYVIKKHCSS